MSKMNFFVKLLLWETKKEELLLLYGFCSPTEQEPYNGKLTAVPKTRRLIWRGILSESEWEHFCEQLTKPEKIMLGKQTMMPLQLVQRPDVLSSDGDKKTESPIGKYRRVTEFWNVTKSELYQNLMQDIGTEKIEREREMRQLMSWMKEECGINFSKNGGRFGNFEFYQEQSAETDFQVETKQDSGLRKTVIKKERAYTRPLLVNCVAEYCSNTICNQTKRFLPEEQELEFTAEEPMVKVVVQIWEEDSGALIFSHSRTLMRYVNLCCMIRSTPYQLSDPYSSSLKKAASNRTKEIEEQIETVARVTEWKISNTSECKNEIEHALEEGQRLFSSYSYAKPKGAFIKNEQKDGEIQSFRKIREYMEAGDAVRIVIADPYFSVEAAEKLLTRINRRKMRVEILTSLPEFNPDTGEKLPDNGAALLQKWLDDKEPFLHHNLWVGNLKRGRTQVFHDRYLLQYFEDGRMDGFLLSNSLNSMGQLYPFVIAPIEREVCLEIDHYLASMRDPQVQSQTAAKFRITCDVLYDSETKRKQREAEATEPEIPAETTGSKEKQWTEADGIESLISQAYEWELAREHRKYGLDTEECRLWMLLSGNASPSPGGFSQIVEETGHISYEDGAWLSSGYQFLFHQSPEKFMKLLEKTKSPLMFQILMEELLWPQWTDEVFRMICESGDLYVQLVSADCMMERVNRDWLSLEECRRLLLLLSREKQVVQMVRLLSRIAMKVRIEWGRDEKKRQELLSLVPMRDWLLDQIAENMELCSQETLDTVLFWLYECEAGARSRLYLELAECLKEGIVKNRLLEEAIDTAYQGTPDLERQNADVKIMCCIEGLEARYGQTAERELFKRIIDWQAFETASEPELRNYAHDKWNRADKRAKWQLWFLRRWLERHPDAEKTRNCLNLWEPRFLKVF